MPKAPLVSVIITTKNEEKNIENCLKSILHQIYPRDKIEIIVVDKDSTIDLGKLVTTSLKNKKHWAILGLNPTT
ncbi:MAG: glycosyltransferase [Nanoarchaeota archaeon]|nr:glycosyltransferase [Nanoarchaeota archaeon]